MEWLTALAGVALLRTIKATPAVRLDSELSLKWPNDLLLGGRKLAGILCEHVDLAASGHLVIVGVGLNIGALPEAVKDFAATIECSLDSSSREDFIDAFRAILRIASRLVTLPLWRESYASLVAVFWSRVVCALPGKAVLSATPLSIDDHAHLVCQSREGEIFTVTTGELSPTPLVEGHLS